LLKNRRYTGVTAFCLAWNHAALLIWQKSLNFLDFNTCLQYFQGLSSIIIFTILAITSNDESVRKLKKNWKKIHNGRVEEGYYSLPLSVKSGRAAFTAPSFRRS
jgi:sulfoxide reductase heme-binding subunit YedZ